MVVPRSEVLTEGQHCDVVMLRHSDIHHPDSSIESLAAQSVKIVSLEGLNMRFGRGRRAEEAGHMKISEGHRGVEKCHRKGRNFGGSKEVGMKGKHLLVKSRQGLGRVGYWVTLGAGVPLNGKGAQTPPLLHPTGTGKP